MTFKPLTNRRPRQLLAMRVLDWASKGYSYVDISEKEGIDMHKVESICYGLNDHAKEEIKTLIPERVALEYSKSLLLLDFLLKRTLEIESNALNDKRVQLQAIAQCASLLTAKNALIADSAMVSRAVSRLVVVPRQNDAAFKAEGGEGEGEVEECQRECCRTEDVDDNSSTDTNKEPIEG